MALTSLDVKLIYDISKNTGSMANFVWNDDGANHELLVENDYAIPDLQEIGAINIAGAGGSYDKIEVTTLEDRQHRYVDGLIADSGSTSNQIACKFLYSPELFKAFNDILNAEMYPEDDKDTFAEYIVAIPNGGHFVLEASIASVQMETVSVNNALTFTVTFAVNDIKMNSNEYVVSAAE